MGDYGEYGGGGGYQNDYNSGYNDAGPAGNQGGGFVANKGPGATPGRGGGKTKADTVFPLTLKRLNGLDMSNGNDEFMIDNKPLGKVCVMGRVLSKEAKNVQITYVIDDGTGTVEVTQWINEGDDSSLAQEARDSIQPNMYVKVYGQVRTFADKLTVSAFSVRRVEDFNELSHHFLSVIYTHLALTKGPLNAARGGKDVPNFSTNAAAMDVNMQNQSSFNNSDFNAAGGEFTPLQLLVLNAFKAGVDSEEGVNVNHVIQQLAQNNVSAENVRKTVYELQDDGHLYSTVDEDHFKTTDSDT